jgi:hypothetical protein
MRILYIDCDSLRPDHLGCYGYDRGTSTDGQFRTLPRAPRRRAPDLCRDPQRVVDAAEESAETGETVSL